MQTESAKQHRDAILSAVKQDNDIRGVSLFFALGAVIAALGGIFAGGMIPDLIRETGKGIAGSFSTVFFFLLFFGVLAAGIWLMIDAITTWVNHHKIKNYVYTKYIDQLYSETSQS